MILHLGVIDVPYDDGQTTGDVAEILEGDADKEDSGYQVMGNFAALHADEITEFVEISIREAIENLIAGVPVEGLDPFAQACIDIGKLFPSYLNDEEIVATGQTGVPTKAALLGVRTSFKKKSELVDAKTYRSRVRGMRRPSFVDTGLYRDSFLAWVDEK